MRVGRFRWLFYLGCVAFTLVHVAAADTPGSQALKVIFDTDIDGDNDDVAAAAILHALADANLVELLAMGVVSLHAYSPACLDAINTYYGRGNIPIGVYKGNRSKLVEMGSPYAKAVAERCPNDIGLSSQVPDVVGVYRRALSGQPDGKVTIIAVGQMNNLIDLLASPPDEFSILPGRELVRRKVIALFVMAPYFNERNEFQRAYNFVSSPKAAVELIDTWPTKIKFGEGNLGHRHFIGSRLSETSPENPARIAFESYFGAEKRQTGTTENKRHCADPTTVLYAIAGTQYFGEAGPGMCEVRSDGHTRWNPERDNQHFYNTQKLPIGELERVMEELLVKPPKHGTAVLRSNLLERYQNLDLVALAGSSNTFHPFPTSDERTAWERLPAPQRASILAAAEPLLRAPWPSLPATLYMDFARSGDRRSFEQPYFARRSNLGKLVLAECVEGSGRYVDEIINGIWAICEESTWVISGHNRSRGKLPDISTDLSSAHHYIEMSTHLTGAQLAWTHYLLRARLNAVDPLVSARIQREVKVRLLDPFLKDIDYDRMRADKTMLLNNHAPWSCEDCLSCFLLLESDPQRRAEAVRKAMVILDLFIARYPADGGCDEGPGYWSVAGGALFDSLELLRAASIGRIDIYDEPLLREIGRYIYRAHISGDYFINFADAGAKEHPEPGLVYRFGQRIGDERMVAFGRFLNQRVGSRSSPRPELLRALPSLFDLDAGFSAQGSAPLLRDVWLPGLQVMAAREQDGSDRGFYLAAKGGHNNESHNHNDVGQFIVYLDGTPILIDPGIGVYTRQTFSADRYKLWPVQSAYHNLPTVNGVMQKEGAEFRANNVSYRAGANLAEFRLDIAGAYPRASGLQSWQRTCRLARGTVGAVEITDEFVLEKSSQDITLSLMTPLQPAVAAAGKIDLGNAWLLFNADELTVKVEPIQLDDANLQRSWGQMLYRMILQPMLPVEKGAWAIRLARK
jgi:Heparinase II/III-like protein